MELQSHVTYSLPVSPVDQESPPTDSATVAHLKLPESRIRVGEAPNLPERRTRVGEAANLPESKMRVGEAPNLRWLDYNPSLASNHGAVGSAASVLWRVHLFNLPYLFHSKL